MIFEFFANEETLLSLDDKDAVKWFVVGLFEKVIGLICQKTPPEDIAIKYDIKQLQIKQEQTDDKIDQIYETVQLLLKNQMQHNLSINSTIIGKTYTTEAGFIPRKIGLYRDIQEKFSFSVKKEEMFDACISEKHVVLLGEAGTGKSIAVDQLAA